MIVVKPELGAN